VASGDELAEYYRCVDFRKWEIPDLFPNERAVLLHLDPIRNGSNVLDIGCSTGRLLSKVVERFRCYGVEINADAARIAAQKGITQLEPATWDSSDDSLRFEAIVLVDVFEHLMEPSAFLAAAARRLSPGGRLIVCTGDGDAPAIRGDPANFWYFRNIEHICMITRRYAEHFAHNHGLRVSSWERVSHYDSTFRQRSMQWCRERVFEIFHRNRHPLLKPLLRLLPAGKKAARWTQRPLSNLTADHVIAVFENRTNGGISG
jgi:SAM-dependent methyltransferase